MAIWYLLSGYMVGDYVTPTVDNGYGYLCTVAGASGAIEPTWVTTLGSTQVDGSVTWQCTYGLLDWDQATMPNGTFSATRTFMTSRSPTISGYEKTRPMFTKDWWVWKISWDALSESGYQYVIEFFDSHRGGVPFHIKWLEGWYGLPEGYDEAAPGGIRPFDSEVAPGYGEGPTILVRFNSDEMQADKIKTRNDWWTLTFDIRQVDVDY